MSAVVDLELPRLVMRRASAVALAALLAVLAIGFWRTNDDIEQELRAATSLAAAFAHIAQATQLDDRALVRALHTQLGEVPLRHLTLTMRDGQGRLLLGPSSEREPPGAMAWVLAAHQRAWPTPQIAPVTWHVPRAVGPPWRVVLEAAPHSERHEALVQLGWLLAALIVGAAAMLGVMAWSVRRSLQPLQSMLGVIARIRGGDFGAARTLATARVRELQAVNEALAALGAALAGAEADRRVLSHKVLTLQEEERSSLARELHDEFGQQLTALRLNASVLARMLRAQPGLSEPATLAAELGERGACMQREVRNLLERLAPRAGEAAGGARLQELLQSIIGGWQRAGGSTPVIELDCALDDAGPELSANLVLAVYRMSQEALTNVARHAQAQHATLMVRWREGGVDWRVCDDGIGLGDVGAAALRGNGLAGVRERAWAFGGDLAIDALRPGAARPGLRLSARLTAAQQEAA